MSAPNPAQPAATPRPVRVSVVDDAVVVRGLLSRWLTEAGGIEVVSTHRTGADAVAAIASHAPDVIVLDIEMPDMDGVTALPLLLRKCPGAMVIMVSTLTGRNAELSLRCLQLGAADCVPKPTTNRELTFSTDFRREVVSKVRALGALRPRASALNLRPARTTARISDRPVQAAGDPGEEIQLRPFAKALPRVLAIGASTGGPNAINDLLKACRPALQHLPVVITQHMPPLFTATFADHLRRIHAIDASEAQHGELIENGRIYVAPGGRHMRIERSPQGVRAVIDDSDPINFCRPSVDMMLLSVSRTYGPGTIAAMLTGMGSDGLRGATAVVEAGGSVIAQDEASSVVWGMPGAVARRGLCSAVAPVEEMARLINEKTGARHDD